MKLQCFTFSSSNRDLSSSDRYQESEYLEEHLKLEATLRSLKLVHYLKLTASLHLKMDGWKTFAFPFGMAQPVQVRSFPFPGVFFLFFRGFTAKKSCERHMFCGLCCALHRL